MFKQQKNTKEQAQEPEKQENATEKQEKAPKEGELSDPEIIDDEQENAKTNYPAKLEDLQELQASLRMDLVLLKIE